MVNNAVRAVKHAGFRTLAIIAAISVVMCAINVAHAELADWFTEDEIRSFGLDALSREQRDSLADWIEQKTGAAAQEGRQTAQKEMTLDSGSRKPIQRFEANIIGEVNGWSGVAQFTLDNGQVWAQRGSERSSRRLSNPAVVIERNFLGFYVMTLSPTGQRVKVKRVK